MESNNFLLGAIILFIIGALMMWGGWKFHNFVIEHYNCIPCTIFDKETDCEAGWDSKENYDCQESMEWPWKVSMMIVAMGFVTIIMPFIIFIGESYEYFKEKRNEIEKTN